MSYNDQFKTKKNKYKELKIYLMIMPSQKFTSNSQ
jgi:hypothetical protein